MAKKTINLQMFADGENNNSNIRVYGKQFREWLKVVFETQAHFRDFFAGDIETVDGISENATAFSVKTSDIAPAIAVGTVDANGAYTGGYSTDANTAFGTGTAKTSRFGNRTEVIYQNTDVPYSFNWTIHEGLDRHTVNNDLDAAVDERLELNAQAKILEFNKQYGAYISTVAKKSETLSAMTVDGVTALFNAMSKYFVNIRAVGTKVAKVTPDIWNLIIDNGLATSAKGSTVNIDRNEVQMFKGFVLEQYPEDEFQDGEVGYFYVQNIGKAFVGINTMRTIESEDFDGVALQGAGKGGQFCPADNQKAVAKATFTGA